MQSIHTLCIKVKFLRNSNMFFSPTKSAKKEKRKIWKKLQEIKMYRLHRPPVEIFLGKRVQKNDIIFFFLLKHKKRNNKCFTYIRLKYIIKSNKIFFLAGTRISLFYFILNKILKRTKIKEYIRRIYVTCWRTSLEFFILLN